MARTPSHGHAGSQRYVYTCDKCGRTIIPFREQVSDPLARLQAFANRKRHDNLREDVEEFLDWLILPEVEDARLNPVPRIDDKPREDQRLIVRCPQHISDWALRRVGIKRNKAARRWQKAAKEADDARGIRPPSEMIAPFYHPLHGPFMDEEE